MDGIDPSDAPDRRAEVDAHFQITPFSVGAANVAALVVVATIGWVGALRRESALPWLGFILIAGAVHIGASLAYRRRPSGLGDWRVWAYATAAITLLEGLGWGLAPFAVPSADDREAMFLVLCVTLCISTGSVIGYGRYFPTRIIAFVAPAAPFFIYGVCSGDRLLRGAALLILVFLVALGHLGLSADRSFRREAALRRRNARLASDLLAQKEAAERAHLAKSRFLAAASHDLRQPVHALGLLLGVFKAAPLPARLETAAAAMETSIKALERLLGSILDLSRLEAGVVEARPETLNPDVMISALIDEFREVAAQKGLSLRHDPAAICVRADRLLLERVVRNLLANALRYTEQGEVRVRSRARGRTVAIQVWDTGCGIAKNDMPFIFEEYYQVGNSQRDRELGLGLGLSIARRLGALMNATVTARSRLGRGSCFEIRLPLETGPVAIPQTIPAMPAGLGLVVVIDDDPVVRDAMRVALASWGYKGIGAASGREALAALDERAAAPNLLMCDLRLPGGEDGLKVVADFRRRFGETLSALLISGDTAAARVSEVHASGIPLLHKPVPSDRLRATMGLLARQQAQNAPEAPVLRPTSASRPDAGAHSSAGRGKENSCPSATEVMANESLMFCGAPPRLPT